ncbi:MAG: choice-of-anchor I family protein [Kiritimatiellia bacterium]
MKFPPLSSLALAGLIFTGCSTVEHVADNPTDAMKSGLPEGPLLIKIGEYRSGIFDDGATEIAAYDAISKQLYVTNGADHTLDVLDLSDPSSPVKFRSIDLSSVGKSANSVAVYQGLVAAAVENPNKQMPGLVAFFSPDGSYLGFAPVGALPDMVTFSPDGTKVIVANEGEPSDDYTVDPEGSVSIIDISNGIAAATVRTADFRSFTRESLDSSVRIFGPGASVAQDLEPEYITVSDDSKTAWVTLQENNAVAIVDLETAKVTAIAGLGFKDHAFSENAFDASNKDKAIRIQAWPVKGMYQPDAIEAFTVNGTTYLVTANEGDARDYDGFSEETRMGKLKLDPDAFPAAEYLQDNANLGRLKTTTTLGDTDGDGDFDELYAYGARSFSVWTTAGEMVYDSADLLESKLAELEPANFNSTNDENGSFDDRSDDKGPEPEGLTVGEVNGVPVLFLGLERVGGVMAFDLRNPEAPEFIQYVNTRNFDGDPKTDTAGDLAPEGLVFVPAAESPNGKALLIVSYEVSGSIAVFQIGE